MYIISCTSTLWNIIGCILNKTCYFHVRRNLIFLWKVTWYFTGFYIINKGIARGSWCPWPPPPFCMPFLSKQPTTGGENITTISWPPHFDTVWPPLPPPSPLWKILATPLIKEYLQRNHTINYIPIFQVIDLVSAFHILVESDFQKVLPLKQWKAILTSKCEMPQICRSWISYSSHICRHITQFTLYLIKNDLMKTR